MMRRSYPEKPAAARLAAVQEPRVSSSLPVTTNTLNPLLLSVCNSHCIAGIPGQIALLAHALKATGSYALHALALSARHTYDTITKLQLACSCMHSFIYT